jgi:hypothetical protein
MASRDGDALRALARIAIARHQGDAQAGLAAANAGLALPSLPWNLKGRLLCEKKDALDGLGRQDERDAMYAVIADHFRGQLHRQYDHAWVMLERGDAEAAAARLLTAAKNGTGCDQNASLSERVQQVAEGLLSALEGAGHHDRAALLREALSRAAENQNL